MVKIVFVTSRVSPVLGLERAVVALRHSFSSRLVESTLLCLGGDENDLRAQPDAVVLGPPQRRFKRLNVWRARRARRYDNDADVVILAGLWAAVPYLLVRRRLPGKVIVWEHSLISEKIRSNWSLPYLRILALKLYRRAHTVVAVSEPLRRELAAALPDMRAVAISNVMVRAEGTNVEDRPPGKRLLFVGSLSATKNPSLAIEVLRELPETFTLRIAGDGPLRGSMERLAKDLGLAERIEFLGHVPNDEVTLLMRDSLALVHTAAGETFGYVYFESADASLPVVSITSKVANYFIPSHVPGIVVEPNVSSLKAGILAVDHGLLSDSVHARQAREALLSVDTIVGNWISLFGGEGDREQSRSQPEPSEGA